MRTHRFLQIFSLAFVIGVGGMQAVTLLAGRQTATIGEKIVVTAPEGVGFSSESLKELDTAMHGIVDKKQLAGVVTLLARHGKVVQHKAYGVQDLDSKAPMQLDTIVRIYSMTKPIAGAAMRSRSTFRSSRTSRCSPAWTPAASRSSSRRIIRRRWAS